jgi:signal transduction histidine kinase
MLPHSLRIDRAAPPSSRAEALPPLAVERVALRRVLGNLLGDAVKFTPDGGRVAVHAAAEGPVVRFVWFSAPPR